MTAHKDDPAWKEVVKGVKPLGKDGRVRKTPPKPARRPRSLNEALPGFEFDRPVRAQSPFDPGLYEKIANGRVRIEFKFDLHGLTEREAFDGLLDILGRAYMDGRRYGLIVTGKGSLGQSPIREQFPKWLTSPKFSQIVSSFDFAAKRHGGDGAFYVLLRRQDR